MMKAHDHFTAAIVSTVVSTVASGVTDTKRVRSRLETDVSASTSEMFTSVLSSHPAAAATGRMGQTVLTTQRGD